MVQIVAIDTGGTFTDLVVYDGATGARTSVKGLTTYDNLVRGIADCCKTAGISMPAVDSFRFGTTLVINTLLQRRGAKTALVTTRGFRDVLEMARGNRTQPFDLRYKRHPPLVSRDLVFEVTERISAYGDIRTPLDLAEVDAIAECLQAQHQGVQAVAVSFLNSYRDDSHERLAVERLRERLPDIYVTCGTALTREWYEYERTSTAAANAYVGPILSEYLSSLEDWLQGGGYRNPYFMMASNGGAYTAGRARQEPVLLIESGPVGGCIAAGHYAEVLGLPRVVAFDMGGTTAKCCVLTDGRFEVRSPYYVGGVDHGFPIRGDIVDIVEVGAGGGSIAAMDAQGRLSVGPKSAGSDPGPACYGRGGAEPTITDANLVLGWIGHTLAGGGVKLHPISASRAIEQSIAVPLGLEGLAGVDRAAEGILEIAILTMADAIKQVTIQRGLDPREFVLVAYGGGGPLHAGELARELSIPEILIPPDPGVFASFGMLMSDARLSEHGMFREPLNEDTIHRLRTQFATTEQSLAQNIRTEMGEGDVMFERYADLKYKGQGHPLRILIGDTATVSDVQDRFNQAYRQRYGHANADAPLEFVQLTSTASLKMTKPKIAPWAPLIVATEPVARRSVNFRGKGRVDTPVYRRDGLPAGFSLVGPAVIEEYSTSTLVAPGDRLQVGNYGEMQLSVAALSHQVASSKTGLQS